MKKKCEIYDWRCEVQLRPRMHVWREWLKATDGERAVGKFFNVSKADEEYRMKGGERLKLGPEAEKKLMAKAEEETQDFLRDEESARALAGGSVDGRQQIRDERRVEEMREGWLPLKAGEDDKKSRLGRPLLKAGGGDEDKGKGGRRSKGGASSSSSARASA
jgi:hypothetical protein